MQTLEPGTLLFGRYRVTEFAPGAGGGQSIGYLGTDEEAPSGEPWRKPIFIKQYHDVLPGTADAFRMKSIYDKIVERLANHGKYVGLPLHLGTDVGSVVAVFPHVQGETLDSLLHDVDMDRSLRVRLCFALTKTIRYLHHANIVHLDLKPENVLVQKSRKGVYFIRLIDLDAAQVDGELVRNRILGSEHYMSPEHVKGRDITLKADIFSLGIILFMLLFERHPFGNSDDYQKAILANAVELPEEADYDADVVDAILRALSVSPILRPTADELLKELHRHYDSGLAARTPDRRWIRPDGRGALAVLHPVSSAPMVAAGAFRLSETGPRDFSRTYYDDITLGLRDFRGSSVALDTVEAFRLELTDGGTFLTLTSPRVALVVDGVPLRHGQAVRLQSNGSFILNNVSFQYSA